MSSCCIPVISASCGPNACILFCGASDCTISFADSCFLHLSRRCGKEHLVQYPILLVFASTFDLHVMHDVYDENTGTPMTSMLSM